MKNFQEVAMACALVLGVGIFLGLNPAWAQSKAVAAGQISLQLLDPSEVPESGTFWFIQGQEGELMGPPLPFNPFPRLNVFSLGEGQFDGQFIVDDSAVRYNTLREDVALHWALKAEETKYGLESPLVPELGIYGESEGGMMMLLSGPPSFPGEGEEGDTNYVSIEYHSVVYGSNDFWLQITTVSNGLAHMVLHGTIPDATYELQSHEHLTNAAWVSEFPMLIGAEGQDWTPATVAVGTRSTLFLRALSWIDTDGDGLPDWWEMEHGLEPNDPDTGNTGIPDGYKDGDNDGWSNLQEYQNGTNPGLFNTPAAPLGLRVLQEGSLTNVLVSWHPSSGPVTGYTVQRYGPNPTWTTVEFQIGSGVHQFTDTPMLPSAYFGYNFASYRVQAHYASGDSDWSPWETIVDLSGTPIINLVRGPGGSNYFVAPTLSSTSGTFLLTRIDYDVELGQPFNVTNFLVSSTNFQNGIFQMPEEWTMPLRYDGTYRGRHLFKSYSWYAQTITSDGQLSDVVNLWGDYSIPFFDGRVQLKQNLAFLLRATTATRGMAFTQDFGSHTWDDYKELPADYAYAGLHFFNNYGDFELYLDELLPFENNYLYRNLAVGLTNTQDWNEFYYNTAQWNETGTAGFKSTVQYPPLYSFPVPTNNSAIPGILGQSDSKWTASTEFDPSYGYAYWQEYFPASLMGIGYDYDTEYISMSSNARNVYGLQFLSARFAWHGWEEEPVEYETLTPTTSIRDFYGFIYMETTSPVLIPAGYFFARIDRDLLPGRAMFSVTNQTATLIGAVGQGMELAGYAKFSIANGYTNKFAYLGQYFDKAYKTTNGVATTNQTGILSPYGEFFPTEPGPTALVTMPDLDPPYQRGTGVVHVIKLQLDVNHDGIMDTTYHGPDNTSADRPFRFWVNNDNDGNGIGHDIDTKGKTNLFDCNYGQIRSRRNLEDFARLWICGVPSLALSNGYNATLKLTAHTGNPKINLYLAYEANGGTLYLTDTNVANATVSDAYYASNYVIIEPGYEYVLPTDFFDGADKYFLFEGASNGFGELAFSIYQGTNKLVQTSAYLDLHDIKDLYERAVVTNVLQTWPEMVQTNLTSGFHVEYSPPYAPTESKELAVFIHGWRMPEWEAQNFAETMFKRFYWQGYQGRFAALRWPTRSSDTDTYTDYLTYNRSEHIAFDSGDGTAAYFNELRSRFTNSTVSVCAHSMGGIVLLESLKQLAAANQNPVDNCVLMQTAVPSHCFDTNVANFTPFTDKEQEYPTPDTYRNYGAGITNALRPGGKISNFFNPLDFALFTWGINQSFSSTNFLGLGEVTMKPNTFLGYSSDGTSSILQQNVWNQGILGYIYTNGTRSVTDAREQMPFVCRPRSEAVGALGAVQGQITGQEFDLHSQLGFSFGKADHSGQFNHNIQGPVWLFYSQLRTNLFSSP